MPLDTGRRGFLKGLIGFVACAPAIVRVSSLMAIPAQMKAPISDAASVAFSWGSYNGVWTPSMEEAEFLKITRRAFTPDAFVKMWATGMEGLEGYHA